MALKHKPGDRVRIIKADAFPELIGQEVNVLHVGPWKEGDVHPTGMLCGWDNDYLVSVPPVCGDWTWWPRKPNDNALAVREENIEAV